LVPSSTGFFSISQSSHLDSAFGAPSVSPEVYEPAAEEAGSETRSLFLELPSVIKWAAVPTAPVWHRRGEMRAPLRNGN
jgi:hypothetical protein